MLKNSSNEYGTLAKFFHWTTSVVVITLLIVGASMGYYPKSIQGSVYNIHKLIGLSVLLFVILRVIWALGNIKPDLPRDYPRWMKLASSLSHKTLYLLLFVMPISGWIMSSAAGSDKHPHLFGLSLGLPMAKDKALAHLAHDIHEVTAWVLFGMILIHISAALYHHMIRKDGILNRMLPKRYKI